MARESTERQAILNLQKYLRQLSFFDTSLPEVPIDGIYDSETREAVEIFQRNQGFAVTGEADRETWDALFLAYLDSVRTYTKPIPIDLFYRDPIPSYIQLNDVGFAVSAIQYMLNEALLFYDDSTEELIPDGRFSEQTADAVRVFQRYSDLPQTGTVDAETWNRLTAFHNEHMRLSDP